MTGVEPLRIGAIGLGRAFMLMLPTLIAHPRVQLVAACDPREEARRAFERDFGGRSYADAEALCRDPEVAAVYVASPHQHHARHVVTAARAAKHVLVEKPMAITLDECDAMIGAARAAATVLVVGHCHSFDAPYQRAREIVKSGSYGAVRMITALNYTDFLYRPRRAEELQTSKGGGVIFSQGSHQVDVVRLLASSPARSVRAHTGVWDLDRPTESAYTAQLTFESGAFASLTYNGFGHYNSDELMDNAGENGQSRVDPYGASWGLMRKKTGQVDEIALKNSRTYGQAAIPRSTPFAHHHFGMIIVSCDGADLRPMANGVMVYDGTRAFLDALPVPTIPRAEVIDEFCDAVQGLRAPLHDGNWAKATLEVCLAMLESARTAQELTLRHQ